MHANVDISNERQFFCYECQIKTTLNYSRMPSVDSLPSMATFVYLDNFIQ